MSDKNNDGPVDADSVPEMGPVSFEYGPTTTYISPDKRYDEIRNRSSPITSKVYQQPTVQDTEDLESLGTSQKAQKSPPQKSETLHDPKRTQYQSFTEKDFLPGKPNETLFNSRPAFRQSLSFVNPPNSPPPPHIRDPSLWRHERSYGPLDHIRNPQDMQTLHIKTKELRNSSHANMSASRHSKAEPSYLLSNEFSEPDLHHRFRHVESNSLLALPNSKLDYEDRYARTDRSHDIPQYHPSHVRILKNTDLSNENNNPWGCMFEKPLAAKNDDQNNWKLFWQQMKEAIKQEIEEERKEAEEARNRTIEERNRVEADIREKIKAENIAAAITKETEMKHIEEFAKLAQERLKKSMDDIMELTREKVLQNLGSKGLMSQSDIVDSHSAGRGQWRSDIQTNIGHEERWAEVTNQGVGRAATVPPQRFTKGYPRHSHQNAPRMFHHPTSRQYSSQYGRKLSMESRVHPRQPPEAPDPFDAYSDIESESDSSRASSGRENKRSFGEHVNSRTNSTLSSRSESQSGSRQQRQWERKMNLPDFQTQQKLLDLQDRLSEINSFTKKLEAEMFELLHRQQPLDSFRQQPPQRSFVAASYTFKAQKHTESSSYTRSKQAAIATPPSRGSAGVDSFVQRWQHQRYEKQPPHRLSSPERGRSRRPKARLYSSREDVGDIDQGGAGSMNDRQLIKREQTPVLLDTAEALVAKLDLKDAENEVKELVSPATRITIKSPPIDQAENEIAQTLLHAFKTGLSYLFITFQLLGYFVYSVKEKV